ncbi:MAG TPA: DUF2797 domain-containing protein [Pseudomonadales bacterium]
MPILAEGNIAKMHCQHASPVQYSLPVGDALLPMNALIGSRVSLAFRQQINCVACQRLTKKSFNQGYCYPCFKKLAQCDSCIVSPEKCHFHLGTCREPEWGEANCMIDHIVYLANSSGIKVGITRHSQVPTRWMDQGAVQALPVLRVKSRYLSGLAEVVFKQHIADKTQWQAMLKNHVDEIDMQQQKQRLLADVADELQQLNAEHGLQAVQVIDDADEYRFDYPVLEYPSKVSSLNLDKTPEVGGLLMGIKGQYLIFDTGVINLRKYTGYLLAVSQD